MLEQVLVSALVKILVDVAKNFPQVKVYHLPLIAIGLGAVFWPLYLWAISGPIIVNGLLVGAGAIGLHEVGHGIAKSKKDVIDVVAQTPDVNQNNPPV